MGLLTNFNIVLYCIGLGIIEARVLVKFVPRARRNDLDRLLRKPLFFLSLGYDRFVGIYNCVMISMDTFFLHALPGVSHNGTVSL
jgi:hypothetical protein